MRTLADLQIALGEWSDRTFGDHRDPRRTLRHLIREVQEAHDAPGDMQEYADILLLLLDASRRAGLTIREVEQAAWWKFDKDLQYRTWGEPDAEGVVEHVREGRE